MLSAVSNFVAFNQVFKTVLPPRGLKHKCISCLKPVRAKAPHIIAVVELIVPLSLPGTIHIPVEIVIRPFFVLFYIDGKFIFLDLFDAAFLTVQFQVDYLWVYFRTSLPDSRM